MQTLHQGSLYTYTASSKWPLEQKTWNMSTTLATTALQLQNNLYSLKCLIVDEKSLIGCKTLGRMKFNCSYGANKRQTSSEDCGALPMVIFRGDNIQLPSVCDSPAYNCRSKAPAAIHESLAWIHFSHAVELTQVGRQSNDKKIKAMIKNRKCRQHVERIPSIQIMSTGFNNSSGMT